MKSSQPPMQEPDESTQYMELEKLNETLEKERALVLQTQENYVELKNMYLELLQQSQQYQTEMTELIKDREQKLGIVIELSESFKSENDQLRLQEEKLKATVEEIVRKSKAKEEELRRDFSDQIGLLIENTTGNTWEDIQQTYKLSREKELIESDARVQQLLMEIRKIQMSSDEQIESLKTELREEREKRIELEAVAQRTRADLETTRHHAVTKQNELLAVRSELNRRLKESMEDEIAFLSKEEDFRRSLLQRTTSFEKKIAEYERIVREKDEQIAELRSNVEHLENQHCTAVTERFPKGAEHEEIRRLENELKNLSSTSKQSEEKNNAIINELKRERNKLEVTITELKKNAEASPSKTAEMNRLRSLLEEKEKKLTASRRQYRQLLQKVETSLVHLEEQQLKTKKKLEQSIIGS